MCKRLLFVCMAIFAFTTTSWAYPPDNAAVLYYRAFSLMDYPEDREFRDAIWDYAKGKVELTDSVVTYLDKHTHVVRILKDAARVELCDWGLDYSQGVKMMFPKLSQARQAGYTLLAQARRTLAAGDVAGAFDLCYVTYRMARHVDNDCIISHLVGIAINALTNRNMRDFVSSVSLDEFTLTQLKSMISGITSHCNTLKAAAQKDSVMCANSISPDRRQDLVECLRECDTGEQWATRLETADAQFWEGSLQYYLDYMAAVQNALDLPFAEAYAKLLHLADKPRTDAQTNVYALLTAELSPALNKCLCLETRAKSDFNALKVGLELLLIRTRTGTLPDQLPVDMPKDLFSGLDFLYEKSRGGFLLRCQAPDPCRDEIYEYVFRVP